MLKQINKFSYPAYHGFVEHVDGTGSCLFESRKELKSIVQSVQEQNNFLSRLKNAKELLDCQIGLYTAREVFRLHRDLNTNDEHQRAQFILQYPNLKHAGLLEVQLLTKTDKAITVIVSPVEGTTRNAISAIAIPYNLQDEDESPEICFLKGGFLTIEQATASMMIMNPGEVVNPHLPGNLHHFNPIVCSPGNSHSLDSISVITDYIQSTAANLSDNPLQDDSCKGLSERFAFR